MAAVGPFRIACEVCGAAVGEVCRRLPDGAHDDDCACCRGLDQMRAAGSLYCGCGNREIAEWFPELDGEALVNAVASKRAELDAMEKKPRRRRKVAT